MTKKEKHAERFDEIAPGYDENKSKKYKLCLNKVIEFSSPTQDDIVLDIGTGTGAIATKLASRSKKVIGRDISGGMLEQAKKKKREKNLENVEFGEGSFLNPNVEEADIVVTNFALHHLNDSKKEKAIKIFSNLGAEKIIIGDLMFFEEPDQDEPFYNPKVDDPAYVSFLVETLLDSDYFITNLVKIHQEVGVLVGEKM